MNAKVNAGHVGSFYSAGTSMPQQPSGAFPAARLRLDGIVSRCIAEQLRQPAESFSSRGRQFCLWGGPTPDNKPMCVALATVTCSTS